MYSGLLPLSVSKKSMEYPVKGPIVTACQLQTEVVKPSMNPFT